MFSSHVTKNLSAYCHGEVSVEESRQVSEHIMACAKCRTQFEEIKLGIRFAQQLTTFSAPDTLWRDLEIKLDKHSQVRLTRPMYSTAWFRFAAVVLLTVALISFWLLRSPDVGDSSPSFWAVERIDGTLRIGSEGVDSKGKLAVGQWAETGKDSRAQISVSSIGQVELDSNTRVRLVGTQPTEHRLELARGRMSARIWAPPRIFFVDTPSAVAADLGCAYTLEVDDQGAGLLRVTSGWVALELKERESMVPTGAACETRPGVGPGTPYFEDCAPEFRRSLEKVDFDSDVPTKNAALVDLLIRSRKQDTLTLWHLLPRVDPTSRAKVYDRIASLVPPPNGVTRNGILNLDEQMLKAWRLELEQEWIGNAPVAKQIEETLWRVKNGLHRRADNLQRRLWRP